MTTPNHQAELLPCPSGHRTTKLAEWPNNSGEWRFYGFCTCCGWRGGAGKTKAEAIAAWNTRPASHEAELVEALEGILASWDANTSEREKLVISPSLDRPFWSPHAAMVNSSAIAVGRAILAKAKAGAA